MFFKAFLLFLEPFSFFESCLFRDFMAFKLLLKNSGDFISCPLDNVRYVFKPKSIPMVASPTLSYFIGFKSQQKTKKISPSLFLFTTILFMFSYSLDLLNLYFLLFIVKILSSIFQPLCFSTKELKCLAFLNLGGRLAKPLKNLL